MIVLVDLTWMEINSCVISAEHLAHSSAVNVVMINSANYLVSTSVIHIAKQSPRFKFELNLEAQLWV